MTLESTLAQLKSQVETAIAYYGDSDTAPPMHLLEMRAYLLSGTSSSQSPAQGTTEPTPLTPAIFNRVLEQANTETPVMLINVRLLEIYCRSGANLRYAFVPDKVKGELPAGPYRTLPSGISQPITLPGGTTWTGTLYLAADTDGAVAEIEVWSEA